MFNSYHTHHTHHKTSFVDRNITTHEYRAPTDKSIEILRDMEAKVKLDFVKSFPLDSNTFKANILVFKDYQSQTVTLRVSYQVNCIFRLVEIVVNERDMEDAEKVNGVVGKAISKDMVQVFNMDTRRLLSSLTYRSDQKLGHGIRMRMDNFEVNYGGVLGDWHTKQDAEDDLKIKLHIIKGWLQGSDGGKLKELVEDLV